MYNLAMCHASSMGCARNQTAATRWFRAAADRDGPPTPWLSTGPASDSAIAQASPATLPRPSRSSREPPTQASRAPTGRSAKCTIGDRSRPDPAQALAMY
jgi:TPR repeat protein